MSSGASSGFTKQMARNIFYGGSLFFIFIFIGLVFDSERRIPERSNQSQMSEAVVRGKKIWETRNCVGCHSLLGEGAYFAPELGNVYKRRGGDDGGAEFIKGWMQAQPLGAIPPLPSNTSRRRLPSRISLRRWACSWARSFLVWSWACSTSTATFCFRTFRSTWPAWCTRTC